MSLLIDHWSFDPFMIVAAAIALLHERGIASLARRSTPARNAGRRRRSFWFYGGLVTMLVAVQSPLDYWSDIYYWIHMFQHLLLMFAIPSMIIVSAPWLPLVHGLPVRARRWLLRGLLVSSWSAPLRAVGRFLLKPWTAVIAFNVVMWFWHFPGPFDLAVRNSLVHIWLMHASFLLVGMLFWIQFIPSYPFRRKLQPVGQIGALFATNGLMFILAMSQSILAQTSWYSVYAHLPGVSLPPLQSQQIGAGILWVCGDFWCYPAIVIAVRRLMNEEGIDGALDRFLRREARSAELARRTMPH